MTDQEQAAKWWWEAYENIDATLAKYPPHITLEEAKAALDETHARLRDWLTERILR